MTSKVYQVITDRIIGLLAKGCVPWRKPWATSEPRSLVSDRPYRGINALLLSATPYSSPYFITYKQAQERGGHVEKGERGWPVIYWRWLEREDTQGEVKRFPLLRYYTVFNAREQCSGLDIPEPESRPEVPAIERCERVVTGFADGPTIWWGGGSAYYRPSTDTVHMPDRNRFTSPEELYSSLYHEIAHGTGHQSRLARPGITDPAMFGSHKYSKEELVAEMCAAFLCARAGIAPQTIQNQAAYIKGWLRRLRDDQTLVVHAAAQAQKAADLVLGETFSAEDSDQQDEPEPVAA